MMQSDSDHSSPLLSSEGSDSYVPVPDPDDSGVVQAFSGNGFQIVDPPVDNPPTWTVPSFPSYEHIVAHVQPIVAPERLTEADVHLIGVEGKQAVSWEQFKELIADSGDTKYGVVEKNRYEECTVAPGADNDVIVAGNVDHDPEDGWERRLADRSLRACISSFLQGDSVPFRGDHPDGVV
jgi:hypothetical protein